MSHAISEKEIEDEFMDKLKAIIDKKLGDALDDQDFFDFLADLMGKNDKKLKDDDDMDDDMDDDDLREGIRDTIKNVQRGVRNILSDDMDRERWKVMDLITDTIPSLKKAIRRMIKDEVWKLKYKHLRNIQKGGGNNTLATIVSSAVMKHIISKARSLYFKEDYLADLTDVVEVVFMNQTMIDEISDGVKDYYRDNRFALEKSKRSNVSNLSKSKNKTNKNLKNKIINALTFKEPIYKDVIKY